MGARRALSPLLRTGSSGAVPVCACCTSSARVPTRSVAGSDRGRWWQRGWAAQIDACGAFDPIRCRAAGYRHGVNGSLVVVGTPLGNLGDLSPRAATALESADAICCEDTRRCRKLLSHAGIAAPMLIVVNEHEEEGRVDQVLGRIAAGETVVLTSDAGMPGVSDPGELLIRAVVDAGHRLEVVPGPTAAVSALVLSGLPAGRWCFEGFLPRKGAGRRERLDAVAAESRTTVLYEAPHRLERTVADLTEAAGAERRLAVARELTKLHEEIWRGTLAEAGTWLAEHPPRGEIVIVLDGAPEPAPADETAVRSAVRTALARGLRTKEAAADVAERLGVAKRAVYDIALEESRQAD